MVRDERGGYDYGRAMGRVTVVRDICGFLVSREGLKT